MTDGDKTPGLASPEEGKIESLFQCSYSAFWYEISHLTILTALFKNEKLNRYFSAWNCTDV